MFIAHFENTMRNAKFATPEPAPVVRTIQQIREENRKRAEDEARREAEAKRKRFEENRRRRMDELKSMSAVEAYQCVNVRRLPDGKTPAKDIITRVAEKHGMTLSDILSRRRNRAIVEVRHDAIKAVSDERPDMTLPQIGRVFGLDHTSIIWALNRRGGRRGASS